MTNGNIQTPKLSFACRWTIGYKPLGAVKFQMGMTLLSHAHTLWAKSADFHLRALQTMSGYGSAI